MPHLRSALAAAVLGALLFTGCSQTRPPQPAQPPVGAGQTDKGPKHPELVQPFENALLALKTMNEAGSNKDFVTAEKQFKEFRTNWAHIREKLTSADPKLEVHIEDGAVELDHEFTRPQEQIRVYELDEETVKLGRLLSRGAEILGVPVKPELVQKDPTHDVPFNQEVRIPVTLSDHKIEPAVITVDQHTKVTLVVTNKGKAMHEFELGHYALEIENLQPGQTQELTLVMLDTGEWETACHVPGHYEVGMYGKLVVKPAALKTKP